MPIKSYSKRMAEQRMAEEAAQDAERKRIIALAAAAAAADGAEEKALRETKPSLQPVRKTLRPMRRRGSDDMLNMFGGFRRGVVQDGPLDLEDFDLSIAVDRIR